MRLKLVSLVSAVIVLACAPMASAQSSQVWTAIAAAGSVDESDTSIYVFGSTGTAAIKSSVASGTLNLRFPVQNAQDLLIPQQGDCPELNAVLRDTGAGSRVIVRVMQLGIRSGLEGQLTSLGEIDSDAFQQPGDPSQYHSYRACLKPSPGNEFLFDYSLFTYFVEAQLIKSTASANPGLMALQICPSQDRCEP